MPLDWNPRLHRPCPRCWSFTARITAGLLLLACTAGVGGGVAQTVTNPATPAVASTVASTGANAQPAADVQKKQARQILAHLNAVLHFYRSATAFTQKVGEPSDTLYHDEALTLATQITQLAFQSAKAEATLLRTEAAQQSASIQNPASSATGTTLAASQPPANSAEARQKHLSDLTATNKAKMEQLKSDLAMVDGQMSNASAAKLRALTQQREALQGQLDLAEAMQQALDRLLVLATTSNSNTSGLSGDITRLEHAVPVTALPVSPTTEHAGSHAATSAPITMMTPKSVNGAESIGVVGQAELLFDLISNLHQMNLWMSENNHLRTQAVHLHEPLIELLRQTLQQGQTLAQGAPAGLSASSTTASKGAAAPLSTSAAPAQPLISTLQQYEQLADTFRQISAASLPLSQEITLLDQNRANLQQWRDSIDREYDRLFRALLLRIIESAIAIGLIFLFGEFWRRASIKYVQDIRRRRQLLIIRRFVVGFCMGLVLILGFVSQVSSLATFAGFLTAGIAVGLQTILLSVAAYFFIVGRYGVRVGDRISVAGVTGDVMEVGLVRMYVMEMAGTGIDLYPTGRVAVFSNAVLFQATTPLYKQIPGTEYGWREVAVKMNEAADFKDAAEKIMALVANLYQKYQPEIERQHGSLALHWDISAERPKIESRLQYVDSGLEFKVRYPVLLRHAAESDEAVTRSLVTLSQSDAAFQAAIQGPPVLRTTVKT